MWLAADDNELPPGEGQNALKDFFDNISDVLVYVAGGALTLAIIIVGFKVMFALRNGDNVRIAIQNMGVVALAALLIGGAAGIASILKAIGEQVGKVSGGG